MKENHSGGPESALMGRIQGVLCLIASLLGRVGMALVALVLLAVLFYQEENWHGKRVWARAQAEAAASGKVVDWAKFCPPPAPDDENFFKAPQMQQWFTGRGARDLSQRMGFQNFENSLNEPDTIVAMVTIVPPGKVVAPGEADIVLSYHGSSLTVSERPEKVVTNKLSTEIIPLIVMDTVPLCDAIRNLAVQADLNYAIDPAIRFEVTLANGERIPQPMVSLKITNQTALQVLDTILSTNNLALLPDAQSGSARIVAAGQNGSPGSHLEGPYITKVIVEEESTNGTKSDEIPLIVMDDVPVTDAIKNLARQAGVKYALDPKINYGRPDAQGNIYPQPTVSLRWTNLTAMHALKALLANYNLTWVPNPQTGIARVCIKDLYNDSLVDKELSAQITKMLQAAFQPATNDEAGAHLTAALGFELSAKPLSATKPAR
ncbi:MAG TPA: hypothetical protein VG754_13110, partial [Verrucomicrobiae bacterium]|nr:hypothetical protein [Verrucomicrobiae bacterium]